MTPRLLVLCIGCILALALAYLCLNYHAATIQNTIGERTALAMRSAGFTTIGVEVSGRDVILFGDVTTSSDIERAMETAQQIEGTRVVENRMTLVTPTPSSAIPTASFDPSQMETDTTETTTATATKITANSEAATQVINQQCETALRRLMEEQKILFQSASSRISRFSLPLLHDIANTAANCPNARIIVEGHTDSSGNAALNRRLSLERAQSVADYLKKIGLTQPVAVLGQGEDYPIASNESEAGKARNRRIEFKVRALNAPQN